MAINLWEAGGQPTSYNPLPTGWNNKIANSNRFSDLVVSFKAKSPSKAELELWYLVDNKQFHTLTLTEEFKEYRFERTIKTGDFVYFYDLKSKGDIVIQDIQIVEKPMIVKKMPKKNLWNDSFYDTTKWYLAVAYYWVEVDVEPNVNYVVTFKRSPGFESRYLIVNDNISTGAGTPRWIAHVNAGIIQNSGFTIKPRGNKLYFGHHQSTDIFNFVKDIQIEKGSVATAYEPYVGVNKSAVKVPKKNLFNESEWVLRTTESGKNVLRFNGYYGIGTGVLTGTPLILSDKIKPNTTYTLRGRFKRTTYFNKVTIFYADNTSTIPGECLNNYSETILTFTTENKPIKYIYIDTGDRNADGYADLNSIQLEEGSAASAYEPFQLANTPSKQLKPSKQIKLAKR